LINVKICDFGVSRAIINEFGTFLTKTGSIAYMAP